MATIDGGEVLARALQNEGMDTVFSISDIASSPFLRSAEQLGFDHVDHATRAPAVHMADGWARSSGPWRSWLEQPDPGVANLVPGVMCAWMEGVPVLVIGTQRVRRSIHARAARAGSSSGPRSR